MKRINIQVDLENNELFEKSLRESIVGLAKQISREKLDETLSTEIERIVEAKLVDAKKNHYYSNIGSQIADKMATKISKELSIDSKSIDKLVEEKVNSYLDKKVSQFGGIEKYIQNYIDSSIASILKKKN